MSESDMADEVYQPSAAGDRDGTTFPDLENDVDERDYDDLLDEGWSPPEKPLGVTKVGTTAAEQRDGESLDERLAQEVPDLAAEDGDGVGDFSAGQGEPVDPEAGTDRAGRLVAPDEGAHPDSEAEIIATDVGIDGGAAGAEEAAVHVLPDDDPHAGSCRGVRRRGRPRRLARQPLGLFEDAGGCQAVVQGRRWPGCRRRTRPSPWPRPLLGPLRGAVCREGTGSCRPSARCR
ncbi:hypothetical protein GCM10025734_03990 [Kitasatospora paranensis]